MTNAQLNLIDDDEIVPIDQQEAEDDLSPQKDSLDDAVLFNTDWTVETLYRQIGKGNINLDPKFQRREAWDDDRKSKFIESILCNFPIPNVVLAEDKTSKGRYVVIDGKQRLFTILSFLRDEFAIRGLGIRNDLNGQKFSQLESTGSNDVNVLENYPIRTVIIRNWPDEDLFIHRILSVKQREPAAVTAGIEESSSWRDIARLDRRTYPEQSSVSNCIRE